MRVNYFGAVLSGPPIAIRFRTHLIDTAGNEAHASTFIRCRLILLDENLKNDPAERDRILCHELFHFVWVRLGNPARRSWEDLLAGELRAQARGETGWSAEWRKRALRPLDAAGRTRRWREYCCESFCDTAAWLCTSNGCELTLGRRWIPGRKSWFLRHIESKEIPI